MKYPQQHEGEWVAPVRNRFKLACCDCGLVHKIDFKIKPKNGGNEIQYRAFRDNRATAAIRREAKKRAVKTGGVE